MARSSLQGLPDDWVVVDCAECNRPCLVRPSPSPEKCSIQPFGGRVKGRPYCVTCLAYPEGTPDERRRTSDFRRGEGQKAKLPKETFS